MHRNRRTGPAGGFWWRDKYIAAAQASADGRTLKRFDTIENGPETGNYSASVAQARAAAAALGNMSVSPSAFVSEYMLPTAVVTDHGWGAATATTCNTTCIEKSLAGRSVYKDLHIHVDRVVAQCRRHPARSSA
jgi:hypothetical protein